MRRSLERSILSAVFVALVSGWPLQAAEDRQQAQPAQPPQRQQHHPEQQKPQSPEPQGQMTMDCQSMMASRQKTMEDMKAMDARLDELLAKMNTATGQAKVDATAAVVSELVTQRRTMRERIEKMQGGMMHHTMEHMQMGGAKGAMMCPMMKDHGAAPKQ